jgi:hypothetical protein
VKRQTGRGVGAVSPVRWASTPEECPARERVHPYVTRCCQTCGYDPKRPDTWVTAVAQEPVPEKPYRSVIHWFRARPRS